MLQAAGTDSLSIYCGGRPISDDEWVHAEDYDMLQTENERLHWYVECRLLLDKAKQFWGYSACPVGNVWAMRELETTTLRAEQALRGEGE